MFRPFAPAIIKESANEYFAVPSGADLAAQYMLLSVPALEKSMHEIPATLNVDGTGRVQLVDKTVNPLFYTLITKFGEATGVPVLLNTSLNLRGQPIINTGEEAIDMLDRSQLDMLVIENRILE